MEDASRPYLESAVRELGKGRCATGSGKIKFMRSYDPVTLRQAQKRTRTTLRPHDLAGVCMGEAVLDQAGIATECKILPIVAIIACCADISERTTRGYVSSDSRVDMCRCTVNRVHKTRNDKRNNSEKIRTTY